MRGKGITDLRAEVVQRYLAGEDTVTLGAAYGVSASSIGYHLKRAGVKLRSRSEAARSETVNHAAFDVITDEAAYWIGFLMADGCISDTGRGNPKILLKLARQDGDHVRRFAAFLEATNKIQIRANGQVAVSITSARLAQALAQFGVVPRKSYTAQVHGLELNRHFWRGEFDGDGSLGINVTNNGHEKIYHRPRLTLTGSYQLLGQFRHFLTVNIPDCRFVMLNHDRYAMLQINDSWAIQTIHLLYDDCQTTLPRKQARAQALLAQYVETHRASL